MKYIIEESEKYEGCYNIYDKITGTRVHYFAEVDGKNKQLAEEWVKRNTPNPLERESILDLIANDPTPPVNESWEKLIDERFDFDIRYAQQRGWKRQAQAIKNRYHNLKAIIRNLLSTARQEAHSVGKRSGMEELYRELMKTIAFPDWQKVHIRKVLETRLESIDSLTSKGDGK